uniref:Uncharacterized protein n=1 Tax=Ciona savignyi TaxID=51511 RepID=H2YM95_CIOSA
MRSTPTYQHMHRSMQSNQMAQQQRYQIPFYLQADINRYGQNMQEINWQQQSLYQQSRHINPYEQHKEMAANSGLYNPNPVPSQFNTGLQNNEHGVIPSYPSDGGSYHIPHDGGYNRPDPYFENEYLLRGIPPPNTTDAWNQCRPQQNYQINGSDSSNVIGGQPAVDGEQGWHGIKDW